MTFVGSRRRMIVYDDVATQEKIKIFDARVERPPHYDTFAEFQYAYHYGDIHCPYIKQDEPLKTECQHFLDCILTGAEPLTSGTKGLDVVRILEASSQSLKHDGAPVQLGNVAQFPDLKAQARTITSRLRPALPFGWSPMASDGSFLRIAPDVKLGRDVRVFGFGQPLRVRDRR